MRLPTALIAALLTGTALADPLRIEVIPLRHHSAEEILPVLRPLVPEPGSVNAYHGQLVVRSTPAQLDELRAVIAELDRAPRNLVISVRHGTRRDRELDRAAIAGEHRTGDLTVSDGGAGGAAEVRVLSTRSRDDARDHQTLRVLEGSPAFISVGEEVPVASRNVVIGPSGAIATDTVDYRRATSGFFVRARVSGDGERVHLDIAAERTRQAPAHGGVFATSSAYTTLTAGLGEWIELGGNLEHAERRDRSTLRSTRSSEEVNRQIFLKVEVAP